MLKNIESIEDAVDLLGTFFKTIFTNLNQQGKSVQGGAALCLTRIIQNSPADALLLKMEYLS